MKNQKKYLCVHAHFYQPPRENPWTGVIEKQPSAKPFDDWNERIFYECYLPNTQARILDHEGNLEMKVNNFERVNFNVGPTLMSWLEAEHPYAYEKILEADQVSVKHFKGHGNAIAQVYNHMILPLANLKDKVTQVRWGIYGFKVRFGREPESIWLAETACDQETVEVLIEEGIRYLILDPSQAESIRLLKEEAWHDVSYGTIDPKKSYRLYSTIKEGSFIDIFFYDGPVAKAVSFEDLLVNAHVFCKRLEQCLDPKDENKHPLIHYATDGETYGHHKEFGEMGLAYLLFKEASAHGFEIINYGLYLEEYPPEEEVRIKKGEDGKGTAWSCEHGVKRWMDDCGCSVGGEKGWNQKWRKPLREALDWLRDELARFCEKKAAGKIKDFWEARNDYVSVILDSSDENTQSFFKRHQAKALSGEEQKEACKLFEIQRHAMLMYTSCGWFFSEISGIETVQILKYAAHAIDLKQEIEKCDLENNFLNHLEKAKSNRKEYGHGKKIYEELVIPSRFVNKI